MTLQGHSTKRRLPCTALTYPKSANTSGLPLRKYQTEEVSNMCTTQHPLARGVGDGAILHWFVHLDGHDSRGSAGEMADHCQGIIDGTERTIVDTEEIGGPLSKNVLE
jgi:hypothetical protein